MRKNKQMDLSIDSTVSENLSNQNASETDENSKPKKPQKTTKKTTEKKSDPPWSVFIQTARDDEIISRFSNELKDILSEHDDTLNEYCFLGIIDPESFISTYDLNRIFSSIRQKNLSKEKDILLMLISHGGNIEPAYQISKICKAFSKEKFVTLVPRQAKSAATLICLGADEIHMGQLGHLGPIDPQLDGLPALGVSQALESIASMAEKYPGSSDMFARYLRMALTVEQIGYCERISESAEQYAERLLLRKANLKDKAKSLAKELVYEYKDHGFVIDFEEAKQHLGDSWILTNTDELIVAEKIYNLFDFVNLLLGLFRSKRMLIVGSIEDDILIFNKSKN